MADKKIHYAVVGLGWITQDAVLPAFLNAQKNSELTALVSDDPVKLKELSKKYKVPFQYSYEQYQKCLKSGLIDAVYIALPNSMHCRFAVEAAQAGVHVLCEKPMAVDESECEKMIKAAEDNKVKLMVAYRLHFEESNLKAIDLINKGKLGDVRIFNSTFTMSVKEGDIRLKKALGGGTLYDIGIYCLNASRYLFRDEPIEVTAFSARNTSKKFNEVDEMTSAILRYPDDRLATFVCSFGAAPASSYEVVGTKGMLRVEGAYHHNKGSTHKIKIGEKESHHTFPKQDQFAPELIYFSDCILNGKKPEPSGHEGLIDVHIIRALYESARQGKTIKLMKLPNKKKPTKKQMIKRPPSKKPKLIHAKAPHG